MSIVRLPVAAQQNDVKRKSVLLILVKSTEVAKKASKPEKAVGQGMPLPFRKSLNRAGNVRLGSPKAAARSIVKMLGTGTKRSCELKSSNEWILDVQMQLSKVSDPPTNLRAYYKKEQTKLVNKNADGKMTYGAEVKAILTWK
jgi:hypothetical protein